MKLRQQWNQSTEKSNPNKIFGKIKLKIDYDGNKYKGYCLKKYVKIHLVNDLITVKDINE